MQDFWKKIQQLQWDDHRYYHQCRINQTLHFISAISFLVAYGLLFIDPAAAGIVGWVVGMVTRQSGHIFFEPRGYDAINGATDAHKERYQSGLQYAPQSHSDWCVVVAARVALAQPQHGGLDSACQRHRRLPARCGLVLVGAGGGWLGVPHPAPVLFAGAVWGLAWAAKILLDPFHNVAIYWQSPLALMRGQRYDPIQVDGGTSPD